MTEEDLARIRTIAIALFSSLEGETQSPREAVSALLIATGMCAAVGSALSDGISWDDADFQAAARVLFLQGWGVVHNALGKASPPPRSKA